MFVEKLNRKQEGVYVIEEEKLIVNDGVWEGFLAHDNVIQQSISIYTGPKFTGKKVENYFISTPSETPWKIHLKVFSNSEKIYITYETTGDQVEAEDINLLQNSLAYEMNRSKIVDENLDNKIKEEIQRSTTEDSNINNKLNNEINRSINMDNKLNKKIDDETKRSQNVEGILNTNIIQEISRAKDQEQALQSSINAEVNRSKKEERDLSKDIDNERVRAIEKENAINSTINSYIDSNNLEIQRLDEADNKLESKKADKTYVDSELLKKYDKDKVYTKEEASDLIEDLIGGAPEALDTLVEIAEALNNDPNFAATMTNELSKKVDKVAGKGLSDENYTLAEKQKLAEIETGANKYIHPITHSADMIVEDSNKRFVSDMEKANWNSKETVEGSQAKANKAESNSRTYMDNHSSDIVKHITDEERDKWNDSNSKKHTHSNKSILDKITQTFIDAWNSAAEHIKDTVRHVTQSDKDNWNSKAEVNQIPTKVGQLENDKKYITQSELGNVGYGDMTRAQYDANKNGIVDRAEVADSVSWAGVTGKPTTFVPSSHEHGIANITGLQIALDGIMKKGPLTWNDLKGV